MKKIGVLKEPSSLVVTCPYHIKPVKEQFTFYIEKGAGIESGYGDNLYTQEGAVICNTAKEVVEASDIILGYENINLSEFDDLDKKKFILGYDFLYNSQALSPFVEKKAELYSLHLLPRTTLAQSMDILSSTASILGYAAVLKAATACSVSIPMISGAGGTLKPARILVIGAGVAGLQAIATAKRLGAIVNAFDVRESSRTEVESLGASFVEIKGAVDSKNAGGYAVEQKEDYLQKVEQVLHEKALEVDIVICTAKLFGRKAPVLLKKQTVKQMKPGAVIVDLAAEMGGNCELVRKSETYKTDQNVTIIGDTNLLSAHASSVSFLLSNNFLSFLKYFNEYNQEEENLIINATQLVQDGQIVNQKIVTNTQN
ncbi:NAD(P) transhydrogenase subunit alpha [Zhouia spongiae]|uniref:proton-translocating NAD(P)(+) transhydrogenase n=1 Tax=Zhouia spongiae TaxID=2202721 RepID=A0ABY3YKZ6_9FLAO|nr:NAD(P) transhydrogenase subunit alpha [Zhouia spongiae]UNY98278.1 NAD(P) transhydrogenase subunit alpha [Zhouia spongiae]